MMPGQLGPISLLLPFAKADLTFNISKTGIPSVIQTIKSILDSIASNIAPAANFGGTYIIVASGLTLSLASRTELNTGKPKCFCPPFFGVTPPTKLVPYLIACSEWKVPCVPVKPWQITFVSLFTKTDI